MNNWVLAIDAGGSKTALRLYDPDGMVVSENIGTGSSLSHDLQGSCQNIVEHAQDILAANDMLALHTDIAVGVAGAGNAKAKGALVCALQNHGFKQPKVVSDALTSALGANLGEPVACVALGTGSVGMRLLNDGSTHLVGGWGFALGDEGSGARLGAMLVQALMHAIDMQTVLPKVLENVAAKIGSNRAQLSQWLSEAQIVDYAQLSQIIWQCQTGCDLASEILTRHGQAVERLILDTRSDYDLPVVLLGGLAHNTAPLLAPRCQQFVQPAKGSSLDGAYILAKSKNKWN